VTDGGATLVVAETFRARLTAFDIGPDGALGNRRMWADLSETGAVPDGICLDAEGSIWVADPLAPRCLRVAVGGTVLESAELSQNCFACALGGADGRTLFALTAATSNAEQAAAEPTGRVEAVRVSVPSGGSP
ncbi:MAG TPA: SMP-30/gluconolactonase/LRE family protein, partial [Acidimicrobiales bacterium]|nr:SMP-30/gluconolactonase/LRE family protein [Acidimicrobiales bacterium]